jgi:hypothetical protein
MDEPHYDSSKWTGHGRTWWDSASPSARYKRSMIMCLIGFVELLVAAFLVWRPYSSHGSTFAIFFVAFGCVAVINGCIERRRAFLELKNAR